jgi:hypothetical protein
MQGSQCQNQSCGGQPSCDCPQGCCDDADQCQPGTADDVCGGGNAACMDCTATGGTCGAQQRCEGGTCQGCLDQQGNCQDGDADDACGGGGGPCEDCTQNGGTCNQQRQCESDQCAGCVAFGFCLAGDSNYACGIGGADCQMCQGGAQCVGGQCL